MKPIDLRSDTVTRPSAEMRRIMAEAEVGDDVLGDDPTVIALQERAAELFGKEAGIYMPSGTMTNQVALFAHTRRGDEVFIHELAHILVNEGAGGAIHSQLQFRCFASGDGMLDAGVLEEFVHDDSDPHHAPTRVVALENTHNYCGGTTLPFDRVLAVRELCDRHGLILHLDGARVCNAAVASGMRLDEIVAPYDSISVCLSKGLGAPVGSVLLGSRNFIARAVRGRKVMGGGMRQAGIIAAAGLYALEHNVERLADDHRRARALAERLDKVPGLTVDLQAVQTNIVFVDTRDTGHKAIDFERPIADAGVLCFAEKPYALRFVTHLDVDDAAVEEAGEIVARIVEEVSARG
jgi:threonine aldolase